MIRKTYTPEQIIGKLREAEVHLSQGLDVGEASRKIGVTEQTYYRWRKEYDGMRVEQAKRLKDLDGKNARLKKLVADLSLEVYRLKKRLFLYWRAATAPAYEYCGESCYPGYG